MSFSNKRLAIVLLLCVISLAAACGSREAATNTNTNSVAHGDLTKGEQPFAAKEPEIYQTEVYYTSSGTTDKYFVARNGPTHRFDTYVNGQLSVTELIKDNNRYVIDHVRKIYYMDPPSEKGPKAVNPAAIAFFQNTQHHEFEEIGRDAGTITYRAKKQPGDPEQDVVLTIDQKTGLMIHQDVKAADPKQSLTFELKNVKLEAPDDLFPIPAGYKQVSKDEFRPPTKKAADNGNANVPAESHDLEVKKAHG